MLQRRIRCKALRKKLQITLSLHRVMNICESHSSVDFIFALIILTHSSDRPIALNLQTKIVLFGDVREMPIYLLLHIDDRAAELLAQVRLEAIHQLIVFIHDERVSTLEADYYTRRQVAVLLLTTDLL